MKIITLRLTCRMYPKIVLYFSIHIHNFLYVHTASDSKVKFCTILMRQKNSNSKCKNFQSKMTARGLNTAYQSVESAWQVPYPVSPCQWVLTLPMSETPAQWSHWSDTPSQCHCEKTDRQTTYLFPVEEKIIQTN